MKRSIPPHDRLRIEQLILIAARFGRNLKQAAKAGGIHRATLYRWLEDNEDFSQRFAQAWEAGNERRDYRRWLAHPFRGFRPPAGKGTHHFPRYGKPRISR
jgi:hypothetical protein